MEMMTDTPQIRLLLAAAEPATAAHWADALRDVAETLWTSPNEVPPQSQPEVVVTDRDDFPPYDTWAGGGAEVGVVRLDGNGRGDVSLSPDATPRELRLACRMLAMIVRLRGQLHNGRLLTDELLQQAQTDPLTGLPNRRAWEETVGRRLAAGVERSPRLCVAIVDLDFFKQVNDTHGHPIGDAVLRAAAKALRDSLRHEDLVARLGGDEFGLLLQVSSPASAASVVDRTRNEIAVQSVRAGLPAVTASAGYYVVPDDCAPLPYPDVLLAAADEALRQAKAAGRNRTVSRHG
jgi:diguanylate cyclase (GGDEF)-like protein